MGLGIDFGTCMSSAAVMDGLIVRPVKEPHRQGYSMPSAVCLDSKSETLVVGDAAEFERPANPALYCREFKRHIGAGNKISLGTHSFLIEQLVAAVLSALADHAVTLMPDRQRATQAVLTVPAGYEQPRRQCMRDAGQLAGLSVHLLDEPVAAALYYDGRADDARIAEGETLLVYDLGGGTFDAALLTKRNGELVQLFPSSGSEEIGGYGFDNLIFRDLLKALPENRQRVLQDPSNASSLRLRHSVWTECRSLKHHLSHAPGATLCLEQLGADFKYELDVNAFEQMIRPQIELTVSICRRLVEEAALPAHKPTHVLLVGGSTRIPLVARMLETEFRITPVTVDDPELAVCMGAAICAEKLFAAGKKESQSTRSDHVQRYSVNPNPFKLHGNRG